MICNAGKFGIPLERVEFDEISISEDLAPKYRAEKRSSQCQKRGFDETTVIQRDPTIPSIVNRSENRVFNWVPLGWPQSLRNLVEVGLMDLRS